MPELVGIVEVTPGAPNVIPSDARFTISIPPL